MHCYVLLSGVFLSEGYLGLQKECTKLFKQISVLTQPGVSLWVDTEYQPKHTMRDRYQLDICGLRTLLLHPVKDTLSKY